MALTDEDLKKRLKDSMAPKLPAEQDLYGEDLTDENIKAAQVADEDKVRLGALIDAASKVGAGIAGLGSPNVVKADTGASDMMVKMATGARDMETRRKLRDYSLERQGKVFEVQQKRDRLDPNSERSKRAADVAAQLFPQYKNTFKGKSEEEVDAYLRLVQQKEESQLRREASALARQQAKDAKDIAKTAKLDTETEKQVNKISERVEKSGLPQVAAGVDRLENLLGAPLEKAKELPGYGRAGSLVPNIATSEKSRQIRQQVQTLSNAIISKQFGASQTAGEIARFQTAMGSGKFESEEAMLSGLKSIKRAYNADMRNIKAGYKPEAVKVYTEDRKGYDTLPYEEAKTVVKKQFSPSRNQTKLIYSDGSEEIVDGRK